MTDRTVLVVVRHPVGGIRTFLRYFHRSIDVPSVKFVVLTAGSVELQALKEDLAQPNVRVVGLESGASSLALMRATAALLRSENVVLLHAHGLGSSMISAWIARLMGTPALVTLHDVFVAGQFVGLRGLVRRAIIALGLFVPSTIHCVSHDAAVNLREFFPLLRLRRASSIGVVLNGILSRQFVSPVRRDLAREFDLPPDTFVIGFLGRFMNQKGFVELVGAVEKLRADPDLPRRFVVLCFSPEDGFIREERANVERRGLSSVIRFMPFVSDVGPTLRGLDVVTIPSRWEACPLLPMEVLITGTPLIASDCVGLREVVRDTPARVFPARSAAGLAAAIKAEMSAPSTAAAAAYAPAAATRFDVTARAQELLALVRRTARHGLDG